MCKLITQSKGAHLEGGKITYQWRKQDAAMNIAPDLVQKAQIVLNAVYLADVLGIDTTAFPAWAAPG